MPGLFASAIDVEDVAEAGRLSRRAVLAWLGGGVPPLLVALVSGPSRGEMAALGAYLILVVGLVSGTVGTVVGLRLARQALDLDPTSTTARVVFVLGVLSALWILGVGGLILSELVA